jgi:hypothetical protein
VQVRCSKRLSAEFSIVFLSDPRPTRLPPSTSQLRLKRLSPLATNQLTRLSDQARCSPSGERTHGRSSSPKRLRKGQTGPHLLLSPHQSLQQPSQRTLLLCPSRSPPQEDQAGLGPVARSPLHFDPPQPCSLPPPLPSSSPPCRPSRLRLASRFPSRARPTNKSNSTGCCPSPSLPAATVRLSFSRLSLSSLAPALTPALGGRRNRHLSTTHRRRTVRLWTRLAGQSGQGIFYWNVDGLQLVRCSSPLFWPRDTRWRSGRQG